MAAKAAKKRSAFVSHPGPKILLLTTRQWHSCGRLAIAFREAGCQVDAVCPRDHSIRATSAVGALWVYPALKPLALLAKAIAASSPQLLVPCDEPAVVDLHRLARSTDDASLRALIESSIGDESSFPVVVSRTALHLLAEELQVAVPRASRVDTAEELEGAIEAVGLPAFLKRDGTSGGKGVCLVDTPAEARIAYRRLSARPSWVRAVKRATVDRDWSPLQAALEGRRWRLSLQQAIAGREANSTIFCWRGEVLASITAEVVVASMKRGPSTVLRRIDHPEIERATAAIAKRLHLSGFCGFDFVLQEGTGRAMLIEMNARSTQTSHLALGEGRDLAAAAFSALTGRGLVARTAVTRKRLIALFPGEWQRDPESEYIEQAYHDLPISNPRLLRICMRRPSLWRQMLTVQGWNKLRASLLSRMKSPAVEARGTSNRFSAEARRSQVE